MYPAVACQLQKGMSAFNIYSQTSADSHLFIPIVLISRLYFLPSYCEQKKIFCFEVAKRSLKSKQNPASLQPGKWSTDGILD